MIEDMKHLIIIKFVLYGIMPRGEIIGRTKPLSPEVEFERYINFYTFYYNFKGILI